MSEAAEAPAPDDPFDGRYTLVRELGAGGVGRVWEAVHAHTGRRVALKMLRPRFADDPRWTQRFLREARAVARIRHPNVVEVLDMSVGRAPFIVYELLEGDGLDARLAAAPDGRLDVDAALRALVPVAAALAAAHAEGIVHRDLKPSNVFLARDARGDEAPKVIDFGLAKHTSDDITVTTSDMVLGTPAYMAPEQARSEPDVDAQADVWSFGATLYECLAGALPVDGPNATVVLRRLTREEVRPLRDAAPDVPDDVIAVVDRCLLGDRAQRFAAMREVVDALAATAAWRATGLPLPPLSCTRPERAPRAAAPTQPAPAPAPVAAPSPRLRALHVLTFVAVAALAALVGGAVARWRLDAARPALAATPSPPAPAAPALAAPVARPTPPAPRVEPPPPQPIAAPAPRRPPPRPRVEARPAPAVAPAPAPVVAPTPPAPPSPPADPLQPDRRYP